MSKSVPLPQAVFRRTKDPVELPVDLRMRSLEWALYFGLNGEHTIAELRRTLRASATDLDDAVSRLSLLGLIDEVALGSAEYFRALAASGDGTPRTLHQFLMGSAARLSESDERKLSTSGEKLDPLRSPDRKPSPAAGPASREGTTEADTSQRTRPVGPQKPAFDFQPLPLGQPPTKKEGQKMRTARKLSLRAVMNLIEERAGSREAGQLDIYRVFIRVNTALLKRNGIETLRFSEDRLISDPELERAIVGSVKKTLGIDCPDSLWVSSANPAGVGMIE